MIEAVADRYRVLSLFEADAHAHIFFGEILFGLVREIDHIAGRLRAEAILSVSDFALALAFEYVLDIYSRDLNGRFAARAANRRRDTLHRISLNNCLATFHNHLHPPLIFVSGAASSSFPFAAGRA